MSNNNSKTNYYSHRQIGRFSFILIQSSGFQGMMPGKTMIFFEPKEKGSSVKEILYNGQNIKDTGLETKPGQEIKDVTIVISKEQ